MLFLHLHYFLLFFSVGCGPDPILEEVESMEKNISNKTQNPSQQQTPGQAKEPKPGVPKEPKPPKPKQPLQKQPEKQAVAKVMFSGIIEGACEKTIRIDIFDGDQRALDGPRPKVVANKRLSSGKKEFSVPLPQKDIPLWIGAYCDLDGDGRPGPKDPSGWYTQNPVNSNQDQEGITIPLAIPIEETSPQE